MITKKLVVTTVATVTNKMDPITPIPGSGHLTALPFGLARPNPTRTAVAHLTLCFLRTAEEKQGAN
jgi:hypothetical protein